jgi:hypothetical protein
VFGQAGLRVQKAHWMRRKPDLRISVVVALAKALKLRPGQYLESILRECKPGPNGTILY